MVRIIQAADLEQMDTLDSDQAHWVYNGLDCCITYAVYNAIEPLLDDVTRNTYKRSLALQGPFMDMMLRGIKVDIPTRDRVKRELIAQRAELQRKLNRLFNEIFDTDTNLNPSSPVQVKTLFYGILQIQEVKKRNSEGRMAPSSDRETLEKIGHEHYHARVFVNFILAIRDLTKSIGFLNTPIDDDGRMRCNFNIVGTNTGRQSSSVSDFGTGTNLQNVAGILRNQFVADKGRKLVEIDLEQADSRNVGALAWNTLYDSHGPEFAGRYLDACESGDLHTTVCRMAWADLDWGDDPSKWRSIADEIAYRTYTYRDMAKKLGHGTNYLGQPFMMAMHSKVPRAMVEQFQHRYLVEAFPDVAEWQKATIHELKTTQTLTNLFGRRRMFFGDMSDQNVINAGIAYSPQGSTGEQINHGIKALWHHKQGKWFNLLVQVHDSILFDIPEEAEDELVPLALELMECHLTLKGGRDFFIPLEAKTGWNWGKRKDKKDGTSENPFGLRDFHGTDTRESWHRRRPRKLTLKGVL